MAHEDKKAKATANEGTASALEGTLNALSATSKNMQAIAGQVFDISKQSFEHTTQTLEKLRNARGMDEVVAIQTNFVKEAFEHAAQHARKFSEVIAAFPADLTKTYQDAWLKSLNITVKATEARPPWRTSIACLRPRGKLQIFSTIAKVPEVFACETLASVKPG